MFKEPTWRNDTWFFFTNNFLFLEYIFFSLIDSSIPSSGERLLYMLKLSSLLYSLIAFKILITILVSMVLIFLWDLDSFNSSFSLNTKRNPSFFYLISCFIWIGLFAIKVNKPWRQFRRIVGDSRIMLSKISDLVKKNWRNSKMLLKH